MKKFKFMLFAFAFVIAVAGAFANNKKSASAIKPGEVIYHYTSDSDELADMKNPLLWVVEATDCDALGDIPCGIEYSDDREEFDEFLEESETTGEILAAAEQRKYAPTK